VRLFAGRTAKYDLNVPESGGPATMPPVALTGDFRIDGPEEARSIAIGHRPCETALNGTGAKCSCNFDCANYWLRSRGYKS
jgi:hypothetical protein